MHDLSWVEISRSALISNARFFKRLIGSADLFGVVKSNAYGHGVEQVVTALNTERAVAGYMVASLDEALALRSQKRKVVLSMWQHDARKILAAVRRGIELPVFDPVSARYLAGIARKNHLRIPIHIKIDVGTSRIGFRYIDTRSYLSVVQNNGFVIKGVYSHFADSENSDTTVTREQNARFQEAVMRIRAEKQGTQSMAHIACTAASLRGTKYAYDAARIGIGLYGLWPSEESRVFTRQREGLKPVMTWKTVIQQIKALQKGDTVGYGMSYRAQKSMRLAVLPVGYWDGYDRSLSNCGEVLVDGRRCPIRGRVCMNLMMIELPSSVQAKVGDEVVLLGAQKKRSITAEEIARHSGTINYEVVARINPLIPRTIV